MADHDHSYKQLFSHPELIRDLLEGFVRQKWVDNLDITTLERVSGSYVSDDLREREDDIIWRVRLGGRWVYVYPKIAGLNIILFKIFSYIGCGWKQKLWSSHAGLSENSWT